MIRLRAGNRHGAGSTRGAYSETDEAGRADARRQLGVRRRVVAVDPAAEDGDRRASGLESSTVRLAVDAAREAADDDEAGCGELTSEHASDLRAVRRACAGADDGDGGPAQGRAPAAPRTNRPGGGS